ncbi:putative adhesion G protein-coupled receptor E4P [Protopterus annectens]|uniref:putative adhesion G protein-coupled receptor E4P n=1 Tax=Protopterus annectens TaxID=7888 RepID=UPI001CFA4639|nr:putative adhesion G protein-coupled receptor E4P [Protopterus annectens]
MAVQDTPQDINLSRYCVFLNTEGNESFWSSNGCKIENFTNTYITCSCYHLTSFAVLIGLTKDNIYLDVITNVGVILSMLFLTVCILTFIFCRSVRNVTTTLQLNLCICMFLAYLLFITGIDKTSNKALCIIIAVFLQFLFLACFAWMGLGALQLYLMVLKLKAVKFFRNHVIRRRYMYPIGYGLPAIITGISALSYHNGYGTKRYCWLKTDHGFLWSFMGPASLVIFINIVLFAITIWILRAHLSKLDNNITTLKDTKYVKVF